MSVFLPAKSTHDNIDYAENCFTVKHSLRPRSNDPVYTDKSENSGGKFWNIIVIGIF